MEFDLKIIENENLDIDKVLNFMKKRNFEKYFEENKNSVKVLLDCDDSGVFYNVKIKETELFWNSHESELKLLSNKFPEILFVLKYENTEYKDFWIKYFKHGKMQVCQGKITYPQFDEQKLC